MLAAENWCVKVNEKVYGPYSTQQMRKLAHEGRLASWSMVSAAGSRSWRKASDESTFADFFGAKRKTKAATAKSFGKREMNGAANESAGENAAPRASNFVLIFDVVSGAASRIESAITNLGPAFRLTDNVWSVTCEMTAVGVRNALAPFLSGRESLFVVDATNGRTSWRNYPPPAHAKISAAYMTVKN